MKTNQTIWRIIGRKMGVFILLSVSFVAFATLGDGKAKSSNKPAKSLLSNKVQTNQGNFSLRSGYNFRGTQVINNKEPKFITLNTTLTYQNGHTTYVLPVKKKLLLDKITFNPNASTRY